MHLFLDDIRNPSDVTWTKLPYPPAWTVVRNYNDFVATIEEHGVPEFVTFDHDLADFHYQAMLKDVAQNAAIIGEADLGRMALEFDYGVEKTGYDCAKWLVNHCHEKGVKFPNYAVHSMNHVGSIRIYQYVNEAKKHLGI